MRHMSMSAILVVVAIAACSAVAASQACACSDNPPSKAFSCQQQKDMGKCGEDWMKGFCQCTCGTCPSSPTPSSGSCTTLHDAVVWESFGNGVGQVQKFEDALSKIGMIDELNNQGIQATLFAWTDNAWTDFLSADHIAAGSLPTDSLKVLVALHTVPTAVTRLTSGQSLDTSLQHKGGQPVSLSVRDGSNGQLSLCAGDASCANVIAGPFAACEEVVYVVDKVLTPPS